MAEGDRPLPVPPRRRFGGPPFREGESSGPSTADRMAQAAAEGRLEEFMQRELPEGEHARSLAKMMLGMTGMLPPDASGAMAHPAPPAPPASPEVAPAGVPPPAPEGGAGSVPREVLSAVEEGDVAGLASLLRAEHERRAGARPASEASRCEASGPARGDAPPGKRPGIDAALVEELARIAADNDVGVDWLVLRAVRLYVAEHRRSGRL